MVTFMELSSDKRVCFCGHDCSKCNVFLATSENNESYRKRARDFYRLHLKQEFSSDELICHGGKNSKCFALTEKCPFKMCCLNKSILFCTECTDYPCSLISDYEKKYVKKCNQVTEE